MKIYAVRDRLLNYYMQPFAAPGDKEVLAALSQQINNEEDRSAVTQAPHHFEIWRLGEVNDKGDLVQDKEFLADASSLIRARVRQEPLRGTDEAARAYNQHQNAPGARESGQHTQTGPIPGPGEAEAEKAREIPRGPGGSIETLHKQ